MQQELIFIADPRILAIPAIENHEPMIDIMDLGTIIIGPSPEIPNNTDYTKMRRSVYERLLQAQAMLMPGLYFCLYEGYRSLQLQEMLFRNRLDAVKTNHPTWTYGQVFDETTRLVSPVINKNGTKNIPPHSTGAAVDVYLLDQQHQPIDMGIHPKDWMLDTDGSLSQTQSDRISAEAQQNRKMMSEVLSTVGFSNYPTEYWHWSYGDRYWAYQTGQATAIYKSV